MANSSATRMLSIVALAAACLATASASYYAVSSWLDRAPEVRLATASQVDVKDLQQAAEALRLCVLPNANKGDCSAETALLTHLAASKAARKFAIGKSGDVFDVLLIDKALVLTKKNCSVKQYVDHHMGWSAWSKSKAPANENEQKSGQFGAFHSVNMDLRQSGSDCAIVMGLPLPRSDVKRVNLGMLKPDKSNGVWSIDHVFDGVAGAKTP